MSSRFQFGTYQRFLQMVHVHLLKTHNKMGISSYMYYNVHTTCSKHIQEKVALYNVAAKISREI